MELPDILKRLKDYFLCKKLMDELDLQLSVFVQRKCKPSQFLLNQLQGTVISNYVNVYVHGNDDFPKNIRKTPTIIYKNYPYTGKSCFFLVDELLSSINEIEDNERQQEEAQQRQIQAEEEKRNKELDVVTDEVEKTLDGFSTLYDNSNHTMLTENGFKDDSNIDFEKISNAANDNKKEYDINELIEQRRNQIVDLVPPKSN